MEPGTGLSPDAVVVFDAIAGRGDHDAAELPARVGLARQRVHDAMSELVRGGLASVVRGQSGALRVRVDSSRAVRSLVRSGGGTGAAEVLRSRSTLAAVVDGAEDASIGVERITDLADVQARLEEFATSIRREVLVLAAGEMPSEEQLREARETDLGVLRRGIAMLMVYPYDVCRTAYARRYAADLIEAGARSRFADDVPCRMWVFDQRTAMVPVNGRTTRDGVYVVSGGPFVRSLRHWAMTLWRHGKTIDQVADDAEGGPTPFERRVLLLMSSGVTDAVAARQLGVTERTFRRHAAAILRRLGATSRFQAGVRAVERGWL